METEIIGRIHIAIEGYSVCQHLVIYQIERRDDNYIKKDYLAKLRFDYNEKSGKIKLYPPFYCAKSFEHMKDECREKLREWLKYFKKHYKQYYENDFFKIDVNENISKDTRRDADRHRIIIKIVSIEEFLDENAFERDTASEVYKSYKQYKQLENCETRSGSGELSIEIRPYGPKEQDYAVAKMFFDIWHIGSGGVPMPIDEFYNRDSSNTCIGYLYAPSKVHKDFEKESVKIAVRKNLIKWINDFDEHYETYKDYNDLTFNEFLEDNEYLSINETSRVNQSQETYDEYTDNYDEKDDFDLERDEYDAGYRED